MGISYPPQSSSAAQRPPVVSTAPYRQGTSFPSTEGWNTAPFSDSVKTPLLLLSQTADRQGNPLIRRSLGKFWILSDNSGSFSDFSGLLSVFGERKKSKTVVNNSSAQQTFRNILFVFFISYLHFLVHWLTPL